jgi:hypothetical protein
VHLDDPSKEGMVSLPTLRMKSRLCPCCCCCCCCPPLCGSLGRFLSLSPQYRLGSCLAGSHGPRLHTLSDTLQCPLHVWPVSVLSVSVLLPGLPSRNWEIMDVKSYWQRYTCEWVIGVYCLPLSSHALHVGLECPEYLS